MTLVESERNEAQRARGTIPEAKRRGIMIMKKRPLNNFAIIGAGMVGTAIGFLLRKAGFSDIS